MNAIKFRNTIYSILVIGSLLSSHNIAQAGFFDWLGVSKENTDKLASLTDTKNWTLDSISNNSADTLPEVTDASQSEGSKIEYKVMRQSIRQVTAYNVGDIAQTDSTPCIGATGVDLCEAVAKGIRVCAANFVPKGAVLRIFTDDDQSFECVVWDRMHERFASRVDIAMNPSEKIQAKQFGLQKLKVQILEKLDVNQESI